MQGVKYEASGEKAAVVNIDLPDFEVSHGMNVFTTCLFIVGVIAGTGFLTLPKAVDDTGWIGFILVLVCCAVSGYTGHLLGKCWMIVRQEYPYLKQTKIGDPYPKIAELAYGKIGRHIVSFSIFITMFGGTIVYVLIAAENIKDLLSDYTSLNVCYLSLIVGGAMTPVTWLGTPKDFWGVAAAATLATGTASVMLFIAVLVDKPTPSIDVTHTSVSIVSFFTGYGTICFAFNGHAAFPTFQSDMKNPDKFGGAIILGYIIVLLMYLPSTAVGYAIIGDKVQPNIILNMSTGPVKTIVSILMTAHLLFGIVIVLNPVSQAVEQFLNIPNHFNWRRVVSRTVMMAAVLFVAESVPHFSSILSLVGGSTISILAIIFPPIIYMKLAQSRDHCMKIYIPLHKKILHYEIILIGIVAGCAATYSALVDLASNTFTVPCYVNPDKASH